MQSEKQKIAVIGLGYVGLPLLIEFSKKYECIGFDINTRRITELQNGTDNTLEVSKSELSASTTVKFTTDSADLASCNIYIVTVPTPINNQKLPDLGPLKQASKMVGSTLSSGDIVVYESTVYPGATEDVCIPILEKFSGLFLNRDFYVGYSPERINPGDREHKLNSIVKVISGSTPEATDIIDKLYSSVIKAGTYKVSSIKVAEAAKVIENTQRDLNIALINELSIIFEKLDVNTEEVLKAAGTKWNFLPFRPGLVGGHCISVDPYYLTYKAQEIGYHPEVILAGRRINDEMGNYIAERVIKLLTQQRIHVVDSRILIMGLSFKENCPDIRNTRVVDIMDQLLEFNVRVDLHDPWVNQSEAKKEFGLKLNKAPKANTYDAVIIAVAHDKFRDAGVEYIRSLCKAEAVIFDVKSLFPGRKEFYYL